MANTAPKEDFWATLRTCNVPLSAWQVRDFGAKNLKLQNEKTRTLQELSD